MVKLSYEKQNFKDGDILTAEQLNHIEDGICEMTGGEPYQQFVTDGTGKVTWEDRLAYAYRKTVVDVGDGFWLVKVSCEIPSWLTVGATVRVWMSDGSEFTESVVQGTDTIFITSEVCIFVTEDNAEFNSLIFPEKGVYFSKIPDIFTTGISLSEYETPEITWDGNIGTTKVIDEKYLPDKLATKSDVEVAQTAADNNKQMLSEMVKSVATFTFDKQTSGRDTFVFNGYDYYKISDFNPAPKDVISFKGTNAYGDDKSTINVGNNCMEYGFFIVVEAAGSCSISFNNINGELVTIEFTAPSAGLYARYRNENPSMTSGTGQFTLMRIDGLTIKSSTYGSTKKFRITVDDSGALTATDVTT